ncbi:hypothetical protein ANO11243_059700 [Dothideomycetidae sp. 11243]|nr:hypothetical protein ANO11243_059700 [fungal sp. No.11243]
MAQQIHTVAVVGCGVIGMSWASLFLANGLKVIILDPAVGAEERFKAYLADAWPTIPRSGAAKQGSPGNYEFVVDLESELVPKLVDVDFIQENGPEDVQFKEGLLETLDRHARPGAVIASSSSGIPSSTFIGKCKNDPGRVLVGHPFNPPHLIPLVEVVPHPATHSTTISTALEFYKSLGKRPILLKQEVPGFVANRLQAAINNEAYSLISRGVVSAEDLDIAVSMGPGLRWAVTGPITINALGGGGRAEGFVNRLDRLGPAIRWWEEDILKHRFDWSETRLAALKAEALDYLSTIDFGELEAHRAEVLSRLLAAKGLGS